MKNLTVKFNQLVEECKEVITDLGFELPKNVTYELSGRLTSNRGNCREHIKGEKYTIKLAKYMIEGAIANGDDYEPMRTILHEMCHALPNGMSHTGNWKIYTDKINKIYGFDITRTSKLPTIYDSIRKNTSSPVIMVDLSCMSGCVVYSKKPTSVYVKNIERYTCGKCGGALMVI